MPGEKTSTVTALEWSGKLLLLIAAGGALIGMLVVVIWFDEFDGVAAHIDGIRAAVGLLLICVGLVSAIGGLMVKTTRTSEDIATKSLVGELGGLLDRAGGLGLALVIIGALLLGLTLNAEGHDKGDSVDSAATAPNN